MTDQPSYTSHYDHSVVYRQALEYLQAHHPNISYSQATEIAYVVMKLISDQQIQPLLSSLASINQTLDALNVPPVERTATQPDDIDRMHERIKWLLDNPAPAVDLETIHYLLNQLLPNDTDQERAEPLEQRLMRVESELSRWREAVKSGATAIPLPMTPNPRTTTLEYDKVHVVQEVMGHLAETQLLPISYELADRLDSLDHEQGQIGESLAAVLDHVQVLSSQISGLSPPRHARARFSSLGRRAPSTISRCRLKI